MSFLTMPSNLNPGGIIEIQDVHFDVQSSDGSLAEDSALRMWSKYILEASRTLGAPLDSVLGVKSLLIQAGFQDVQQTIQLWPMTWWPKGPRHKKIGGSLFGLGPLLFPSPLTSYYRPVDLSQHVGQSSGNQRGFFHSRPRMDGGGARSLPRQGQEGHEELSNPRILAHVSFFCLALYNVGHVMHLTTIHRYAVSGRKPKA